MTAEETIAEIEKLWVSPKKVELIKEYAKQCAQEALNDAAERADTIEVHRNRGVDIVVDKKSIIETTIKLP